MFAEASCTSQIETARAVASELGPAGARTAGLDKWANIRDQNSERDAHNVIREQRLTLPIKLDWMSLESLRLPWISPRSWLSYLVKHGLWCRLCGLDQSQAHLCGPTWQQFWDNYRKLYPNFHLFSLPGLDLSKTAAVYIHGDEGRTLKRNAFMVTTLQSALGFGSQPQDRAHGVDAAADNSIRLKLNNVGSTFLTRLATLMIPKTLYDADDTQDVYLSMLEVLGQDLDQLLMDGVTGSDGASYRICVIGVKGDLPYLTRVSCSERAWNRASKGRGDGSQNAPGICHLCLAGQHGIEAEQAGRRQPRWLPTMSTVLPWKPESEPPLTKWLGGDATLYKFDIWHTVHLGLGRSFLASAIVLCMSLPVFAASSIDRRFGRMTESYLHFCRQRRMQPHVRKIHRDLVCYGDPAGVNGYWTKGDLTTALFLWLESVLGGLDLPEGSLFSKALLACQGMNNMFGCMYKCDAFLSSEQCAYISKEGRKFLRMYIELASACHATRRPLFPLVPKLHFLDHFMVKMYWDGLRCQLSENPLQTACQLDEDAIGRASRTSRRVSIRKTVQRTFERHLVACAAAYRRAGWI